MSRLQIVKVGGALLEDAALRRATLHGFARLPHPKLLVHGGGKQATQLAARLGVETAFIEGRRITSAQMRDVAVMVYGGLINKQVVAELQQAGCDALGLTGADGAIIRAQRRRSEPDFGYVGDVDSIDGRRLQQLLDSGLVPVLAPLSYAAAEGLLNTNADAIAAETAIAMCAYLPVALWYCFDKPGVLANPADNHSVVARLTWPEYQALRQSGAIHAGMLPKLDTAFRALNNGVGEVRILSHQALDREQVALAGTVLQAAPAEEERHD